MPVLRQRKAADHRPRHPEIQGREDLLDQSGDRLQPMQCAQGGQDAGAGGHAATNGTFCTLIVLFFGILCRAASP